MTLLLHFEYQNYLGFMENVRASLCDVIKNDGAIIGKKIIRLPTNIRNSAYEIACFKKRPIKDPMTLQECIFSILGISEKSFEEILYITSDLYTDEKMANAQMYAAQGLPLKSERKEIIEECVFFIETEFENILHYYKTILKEATNYIIANKISKYGDFKEEMTLVNPIEVIKWATLHFSVDKDLLPYAEECLKKFALKAKNRQYTKH